MPKAFPIFATWLPSFPKPIIPSVFPFNSTPKVVCQYPWYIFSVSCLKFLAKPNINDQVNSAVGFLFPSVPETIMPFDFAYSISIARFLMPLVAINFKFGQPSISFFVIGVLSLIIKRASKSFKFSIA